MLQPYYAEVVSKENGNGGQKCHKMYDNVIVLSPFLIKGTISIPLLGLGSLFGQYYQT